MDTTHIAQRSRRPTSALAIFLLFMPALVPRAWADTATARPSTNGALAVAGDKLVDDAGNEVQLHEKIRRGERK